MEFNKTVHQHTRKFICKRYTTHIFNSMQNSTQKPLSSEWDLEFKQTLLSEDYNNTNTFNVSFYKRYNGDYEIPLKKALVTKWYF